MTPKNSRHLGGKLDSELHLDQLLGNDRATAASAAGRADHTSI
jgi:hypothetical protein